MQSFANAIPARLVHGAAALEDALLAQQALLMQRIDGRSHEETAAKLRVSKSMVEKYIAQAVGALRAALP